MNLNLRQCRVLPLEEAAGTGGWGGHREPAPQGPSPPEGRWPSVGGQLAWGGPCGPLRSDLPLALGVSALPTRCGRWPAGWGHAGKRPLAALRDLAWPGCPHAPGSGLVCEPGTDAGFSPSIPSRVGGSSPPRPAPGPQLPPGHLPVRSWQGPFCSSPTGRARTWTQRRFLPRVGPRLPPACVLLLRMCSCCPSNHTNSASCLQLTPRASGTGAGGPR